MIKNINCPTCGSKTIPGDICSVANFGEFFRPLDEKEKQKKSSFDNKIISYLCSQCGEVTKIIESKCYD